MKIWWKFDGSSDLAPSALCALFACAALLLFFVTPVRATTLLNPLPEDSTTLFGFALAPIGDVDGDGVVDLAVGEPFADGEFNDTEGFGPPQNVGRVFLSAAPLCP